MSTLSENLHFIAVQTRREADQWSGDRRTELLDNATQLEFCAGDVSDRRPDLAEIILQAGVDALVEYASQRSFRKRAKQ